MTTPPQALLDAALKGSEAALRELLSRLDTSALQQGDQPTRALVVLNPGSAPFTGAAVFRASFPVRETMPVTVAGSGKAGSVQMSRLVRETVCEPDSSGRRLWTFDLEFRVTDLPPRSVTAFPATFGASGLSPASPNVWENYLSVPPLRAYETDCHPGDIALPLSLPLI